MVGPGAPASANQEQSYDAELKGATWKAEREVRMGLGGWGREGGGAPHDY